MPKRKRPEETPEEQFKRFVETAKELDVGQNLDDTERLFKRMAQRQMKSGPKRRSE